MSQIHYGRRLSPIFRTPRRSGGLHRRKCRCPILPFVSYPTKTPPLIELWRSVSARANRRQSSPRQGSIPVRKRNKYRFYRSTHMQHPSLFSSSTNKYFYSRPLGANIDAELDSPELPPRLLKRRTFLFGLWSSQLLRKGCIGLAAQ